MPDKGKAKPAAKGPSAESGNAKVILVNERRQNGVLGAIATVPEDQVVAWLAKGWVRKSAGSAE